MAGDLHIRERLSLLREPRAEQQAIRGATSAGRALHIYGNRVRVLDQGVGEESESAMRSALTNMESMQRAGLTAVESLGASAFAMRLSPQYREAKRRRPRQGEQWDFRPGGCMGPVETQAALRSLDAPAPAPTSAYLEGDIAVGIIIVGGPTPATQFTDAERTHVVAEVQNGLSFLAASNPAAALSFFYDIRFVNLSVPPDPSAADLEGLWRNPTMVALGYPGTFPGVSQYVEDLRHTLQTRWGYCGFFTKYPLFHFAYASIGGPRLVMDYNNDGWGPDNIDRVFAHETGHIFMCPDEYASSGCTCTGAWGRWAKPNTNCESCAPSGGISCIMKRNDWAMCTVTPAHLGWTPARLFAKSSGKAMDVSGASTSDGTPIIQWAYHGGENQLFRPDHVSGGYYRLVAQHSGKVLEVEGGSALDGARLVQQPWTGGSHQLFHLESMEDGYLRIVAKHSGKVVDVSGASPDDGAGLIQWEWHGGDNQRWMSVAPAVAEHSGKVLEVAGASVDDGAEVVQSEYSLRGSQLVYPEPVGDGYVRLVFQHSGKVLDVSGASGDDGARLIQYAWHGGDNQQFRLEPLGDGHVRIIAKHSGKVVDVSGASTTSGAELIQWTWHGGDNQRWIVPRWQ